MLVERGEEMSRTKTKIIKFLEIEEVKKFQDPILKEVKEVLQKDDLTVTDKIAISDFAVITLVYGCALRISEACNLDLNYLDLNRREMKK